MAKRSVRKRRRTQSANSHTPDVTSSIAGCQQQGCPDLGLCIVDLPGIGETYLCSTHQQQAVRELRKQKTIQAIRDWEAEQLEPPKKGLTP